jgi:hypothetical protein
LIGHDVPVTADDQERLPSTPYGVPGNTAPGHDWFGNPIRDDGGRPFEPVPCPLCGQRFTRAAELDVHVRMVHRVDPDPGRPPVATQRLKRWVAGLRFLPLWFVLPLNATLTTILVLAWGKDASLFSTTGDQIAVLHTWIIRTSILPSVLLLCWRVVDRTI